MISIPFNFQPESITVTTSGTTIAAGKYAYVTISCESGGTATIDGTTILTSASDTIRTPSGSVSSVTGTDAGVVTMVSVSATTASEETKETLTTGNQTISKVTTASYWVPSGTVISGTGTRRIVASIYNNIA